MSEEDEDLIGSGKALELLEVWQGVFKGTRLVKAGGLHKPFLACCVAREHTPRVPLPATYWDVHSTWSALYCRMPPNSRRAVA